MHGGMHFEVDVGLSLSGGQPIPTRMCRVEHYGKGAPPETVRYTRSRPVPAITGAFMSLDRTWFEELGGFTEEFIFGHYEDADLCLKSIEKGVAPWLHDIRLWHLEGKAPLGNCRTREAPSSIDGCSRSDGSAPSKMGCSVRNQLIPCCGYPRRQELVTKSPTVVAAAARCNHRHAMKILLISLYHPELVRGGAQQVCYELFRSLKRRPGIEPVLLAAIDPSFKALYKSGARITGFDGRPDEYLFLTATMTTRGIKRLATPLSNRMRSFCNSYGRTWCTFITFCCWGWISYADPADTSRSPHRFYLSRVHGYMRCPRTYAAPIRQFAMLTRITRALLPVLSGAATRVLSSCGNSGSRDIVSRRFFYSTKPLHDRPLCVLGTEKSKIHHVTNGQPDYSRGQATIERPHKRNRFGFSANWWTTRAFGCSCAPCSY